MTHDLATTPRFYTPRLWLVPALLSVTLLGTVACAPPPLALATLTIDNLSYMVSGKSVSEHLLSEASDRDCSFGHIFQGEKVCVDSDSGPRSGTAVAENEDDLNIAPATGPSAPYTAQIASTNLLLAQRPLWPDTSFMRERISEIN